MNVKMQMIQCMPVVAFSMLALVITGAPSFADEGGRHGTHEWQLAANAEEAFEPYPAPADPDAGEPLGDSEADEYYEHEAIEEEDEDAGSVLSDTWITTKVKSALVFTRDVPGVFISVTTNDGVVELSGTVKSHEQKALAIETAEDVKGVEMVISDALIVEPPMEESEDAPLKEAPEPPFTEEFPVNPFADEFADDPFADEYPESPAEEEEPEDPAEDEEEEPEDDHDDEFDEESIEV